jgi:exopolyphosphatase/guanosine-5'-triphosphate,3'-diphosphate pyrophosphatase
VEKYRAVATAASREARNRRVLLERVQRRSGIRLEVIDGAEEARLVRTGVLAAVGDKLSPRVIVDLGGGSMQISFLRQGTLESTVALPIGTVRLMEAMKMRGAMTPSQVEAVRDYALSFLRTVQPRRGEPAVPAVACGGNAEALAQIAPGPAELGFDSLSLRLLRDRMWEIVERSVPARMKTFGVRQDRAEVMGIAAVIFTTLGQWLGVRNLIVPAVGVREGVLRELVVAHFAASPRDTAAREAQDLVTAARAFGRRAEFDSRHAEQVRRLALALYDQLGPVHRQGGDARLALELAAVLHDVGYFISSDGHHKHSEYLIRHGDIGTLNGDLRARVGCIARYHSKAVPEPHHKMYSLLDDDHQKQVRAMAALLRIAEALDSTHRQDVSEVQAEVSGKQVRLDVGMRAAVPALLAEARQKTKLFEKEFKRRVRIRSVKTGKQGGKYGGKEVGR